MLQANFHDKNQKSNTLRSVKLQRNILSFYLDIKQSSPYKKITLSFDCSFEVKKQTTILSTFYIFKIYHNKGQISIATQNKIQCQQWRQKLFLIIPNIYSDKIWKEKKSIGSGHFSDVEKVTDYHGRIFAIKKISKTTTENDKMKQFKSIQNEINIMKKISSPYLVKIQGIYVNEKNYYLQLPYFDGGTLGYLKKQKALSSEDIKKVMKDLLTGLVELKRCKVIHRDIKPDNIVMHNVNGQKRYVLIDFGLATFEDAQYIYYRCGTPGYLSPQIAKMSSKETRVPIASDIFSLGAVFYQMIVGKMLFPGKSSDSILYKNRKCSINFHSEQFNKFWPDEKNLIMKMLQKNHQLRITPEDALKHPYFIRNFKQEQIEQIPDEGNDIIKKMKKLNKLNSTRKNENIFTNSFETTSSMKSVFSMSSTESRYLTFENLHHNQIVNRPKRPSINKKQYRRSSFLEQNKMKFKIFEKHQNEIEM